jgi:hypothetical protein
VTDILVTFIEELTSEEKTHAHFKQGNAPEHIAENSMWAIRTVFDD